MHARFSRLFARPKPVVAVLHVGPSPGVPGSVDVRYALSRVVAEAQLLIDLGVDGLLIENAHDVPGLDDEALGPEVTAFMTRMASAVKRHAGRMPVGVRVMERADRAALAVAVAAGCDFVRVAGWAEDPSLAGRFHRYRHALGAERLLAVADVRPGSAEAVAPLVEATEHARPDALVVLGPRVGEPPPEGVVEAACAASSLPLFCGGGLDATNLTAYLDEADGFLIGSGLKEGGRWQGPVSEPRVRALIGAVEYARGQEVRQ